MPKIRILYFTISLDTDCSGPARALVNIAVNLDPERFETCFCLCGNAKVGELQDILENKGIAIHHLNTRGPLDFRVVYRLIKMLKHCKPDIIHSRLTRADFYSRLAGRLTGRPIIINNICSIYSKHFVSKHGIWKGRMFNWMYRMTLGPADWFVVNADGVMSDLMDKADVPQQKLRRIHNAIDVGRYFRDASVRATIRQQLCLDVNDCVIGTVGRLHKKKGLEYLIAAAKQLVRDAPNVIFIIVGGGPERGNLEALVRVLGLEDHIRFLGERTDVPDLLSAMDIFCFPSELEGLPNAVMEAMAAGLPVVATDIPGNNELVVNGKSGYLTPVRDSMSLSCAILELINDRTRSVAFGQMGHKIMATRFGIGKMVREFEKFYGDCMR